MANFTYTDKTKRILEAWGKFQVTLYEDVEAGDLLHWYDTDNAYTVRHADDGDGLPANCIAMEAGSDGDTIWACLKAVIGTITTQSGDCGRGIPGAVYFAAEADFLGAPLYLGEAGKPESAVGSVLVQQVGVLLARDRILLDLQPMFGTDAKGVDWQVYGDLTLNYIKWDSKINRLTIQKTFSANPQVGTYEYAQYIGLCFNTAVVTGKYISGLKIAIEGSANFNSGASFWPLWIDYQNTGINSSILDAAIRISIQAGACMPHAYMICQSAGLGPAHLFRLAGTTAQMITAGGTPSYGGTIKKISIDINGTEYFFVVATTIT